MKLLNIIVNVYSLTVFTLLKTLKLFKIVNSVTADNTNIMRKMENIQTEVY